MMSHYPKWGISKSLAVIFEEIAQSWRTRRQVPVAD